MKRRTGISVLAAAVVVAVVMGFSAAAWAGAIEVQETWLNVQKLVGTVHPDALHNGQGKDNFVIAATFNCEAYSFGPSTDVTLSLDELDVVIPAAQWKKVGKTEKYIAKTPDYTAQIDYWINGSSRCNLKMSARNQDILNNMPNMPDMPVELVIGSVFDEAVTAHMSESIGGARMMELGPDPIMVIDTFMVKKNLRLAGKDSLVITGRCMATAFDPATSGIGLELEGYSVLIPAGAITESSNGKSVSYRGVIDGGNVSFKADDTTKFSTVITNIDLSSVTGPCTLVVYMNGVPGAGWGWALDTQSNRPGTIIKY
jgi:hypothetical protein